MDRADTEALDHVEALQADRAMALVIIKDLLGWADTYEDHMGDQDFKNRDEAIARAQKFLLDRGELLP